MKNRKRLICLSICVMGMLTAFSQSFHAGDKVEGLINNTWKEVKIIKPVAGKKNVFEVQAISGEKKVVQLAINNLRIIQSNNIKNIDSKEVSVVIANNPNLHFGNYNLYSGIPTMYIGHIVLLADGKYKVAYGTDEDNYEIGNYTFNSATNSIEWTNGLFKTKGWGGKSIAKSGNVFRIELNSTTYAETTEN